MKAANWLLCALLCSCHAAQGESTAKDTPSSPAAAAAPGGGPHLITLPAHSGEDQLHSAVVTHQPITEEVLLTGQVVALPGAVAEISAPLSARVRTIVVSEGRTVTAGETLATLDAPEAARVLGMVSQARARRERAETILRQEQRLTEDRATSERALVEAQSEVSTAAADELSARLLLSTYKVQGSRVELTSPLAGTVVKANAVLGGQVGPENLLFRVVNLDRLVVRAEVPEAGVAALRLGDPASVVTLGGTQVCAGHIDSIPRSVDPVRRVVGCRIVLDPGCAALMEGAFVDVVLKRAAFATAEGAPESALAVPRSAMVELDGKPAVFVATSNPNQFEIRPIIVARTTATTTFVRSGLSDGERVIDRGVILLKGEWMRRSLE